MSGPVRAVLIALLALLPAGCGYTWSSNGSSFDGPISVPESNIYPRDVRTVAVPTFTNQTYYRGIELTLSKAVINQLEERTPYKVVSRETADTILEGHIVSAGVRTLSRNAYSALAQEQLYVITVNFTWKDLRSGKILVDRHGFEQTAAYYPTLGENQFVGTQSNVEQLAIAIVEELQAPWGHTVKGPLPPPTPTTVP